MAQVFTGDDFDLYLASDKAAASWTDGATHPDLILATFCRTCCRFLRWRIILQHTDLESLNGNPNKAYLRATQIVCCSVDCTAALRLTPRKQIALQNDPTEPTLRNKVIPLHRGSN